MVPIHELLSRIRWDAQFGRGSFEIAYLDRVEKRLVRVPLERIVFVPGDRFGFTAIEEDGSTHEVPYHRVRELWRDGELIWSRPRGSGRAPRRGA